MGMVHTPGGATALPPFALLSQALPRLSRHELEGVVEWMIDRLNALDPDADVEPNGDERDGTGAEDEEHIDPEGAFYHPGCPVSDPAEDDSSDYCLASDDRGSSGPNALFNGYERCAEQYVDEDLEGP